jgi:hypothetical protein
MGMKFKTTELQAQWDAYQAKMSSPEVVAEMKARLLEARKNYWGSILFLLPVISLVANLAVMWILVRVFHADPDPYAWMAAIGLPMLAGVVLFPRK